jgi:hypothetical protein
MGAHALVEVKRLGLVSVLALLLYHEAFHAVADGLGWGYAAWWATIWRPGLVGVVFHGFLFAGLLWAVACAWGRSRTEQGAEEYRRVRGVQAHSR